MPTYNGANYIKEQIESILAQLKEDDELIISDDSSSDSTVSIVEAFNDRRIKILKNNQFRSPIFNLENALKHATGDFFFLADQDDIWLEDKIDTVLNSLKNFNVVVSDCQLIDCSGTLLHSSFYNMRGSGSGFLKNIYKNSYLGCCMAFDKKIFNAILPFPRGIAMHDMWIGLLAELIGKPKFIPDKLILYRRHGSNFSPTAESSTFSAFYQLSYRIQLCWYLFLRYICLVFSGCRNSHKSNK